VSLCGCMSVQSVCVCMGTYLVETVQSSVWIPIWSKLSSPVYGYLSGRNCPVQCMDTYLVETIQSSMWVPIWSKLSSPVYGYLSGGNCPVQYMGTYLVETGQSPPDSYPYTHRRNELTYSHITTLFITNVNQHSNSAT
jgi:tryptophan-rich sensory protein